MPFLDYTVLVAGSGSIGQRHLHNLRKLGIEKLVACDPDSDRTTPIIRELGIRSFLDFETALANTRPDIVFICTPPIFHVSQALQALQKDAHVFVEKPLSHTLNGVESLIATAKTQQRVVQVGYNFHFHPGLQKVKQLIEANIIGRILWARVEVGQYLPDWRPWQDYRQSYTAKKELGGGILLDASHELNYIIWLLGLPTEVTCMAGKVSNLEVNVEDCVTVLLRFASGIQADIHMDFIQRGYARSCKLVGEKGTLILDFPKNQIQYYLSERGDWEITAYQFEPNQMYIAEVEHFLDCIAHNKQPVVDLRQSYQTLQVVMAAHLAAKKRKWIKLG